MNFALENSFSNAKIYYTEIFILVSFNLYIQLVLTAGILKQNNWLPVIKYLTLLLKK